MSKKDMYVSGYVKDVRIYKERVIVIVNADSPEGVQGKFIRFNVGACNNANYKNDQYDWASLVVGDRVRITRTYNPEDCYVDYRLRVLYSEILNADEL